MNRKRVEAVLKSVDRTGNLFAGSLIRDMVGEINDLRDKLEAKNRDGQISEDFRKNPQSRQWATSYTKRVYDAIGGIHRGDMTQEQFEGLLNAYELLKDYHESQHIVYEQRDEARRDVARFIKIRDFWIDLAQRLGAQLDAIKQIGS
jgi:hypothetical protein